MKAKETIRRAYKKPQINRIKLEIEEAVLTGCKTSINPDAGRGNKYCGHAQCKKTIGS